MTNASPLFGAALSPTDPPVLYGGICVCGHIFFPFQTYGCERCGSLELQQRALPGCGRLIAAVTVYVGPSSRYAAPYVVASIQLDSGPLITAIAEATGALPDNARVKAVLKRLVGPEALPSTILQFVEVSGDGEAR